ncbi:YciI family protein [Cesiribacter andamanensis]|uniref:YCII-related domain-containing protein n=1 Tax=Cesiribacter andamanensis AMV16 TaxID=1279009 RepID=M7N5N6_9BACT|nr:YciI family protein [Cesiribacter andamanensis]EMR02602.1 hypothetical protein ADICEAN_02258 [Cesiribacter andamanensis AMV16]
MLLKPFFFLLLLCGLGVSSLAQTTPPIYNKALADSLGADAYGMKSYVLVLLKTGTATISDQAIVSQLFRGHLDNIGRLAREGKLVVAGPLGKNEKTYRGIFILNVPTLEEAARLLETDPAVKEKLLEAELYSWYGSAALPAYLPTHEKIQKQKP